MSDAAQPVLGSVVSLWQYPVKSMLGEELNACDVTERGLLGDRAYALVEADTGKVTSAKNPRKWRKLLECRATFVEPPRPGEKLPPVRIALPDGTSVTSGQDDLEGILSTVFGRRVTFATAAPTGASLEEYWPDIDGLTYRDTVTELPVAGGAPPGSFFDFAPIHLLTTATIDRLRELYPQGRFEVRRFRPNIVIEAATGGKDFVEKNWNGRTLAIGEEVRLSVLGPCPRCVMTTLPQADLPYDPGILRTAAQHTSRVRVEGFGVLGALVGAYAAVVRGGRIRRGDPVRLAE